MSFSIKLKNIPINLINDPEDCTISEAISTVYNGQLDIRMYWNEVNIDLSMKWDISDMWNDLIKMIRDLNEHNDKKIVVSWPSNDFMALWNINVDYREKLWVEAFWTTVAGLNKLQELERVGNKISIDKELFISEWHKILTKVNQDLITAGYSVESLEDFPLLIDLLANRSSL